MHLCLLVCVFLWLIRLLCDIKRFSHWVHEYNFSPLCVSLWTFKSPFCVNHLSHTVHTYGLGLSSCECSLVSTSILTSKHVPSAQYTQHETLFLTNNTRRHQDRAPAYLDNAVQPVNRRTVRPGLRTENSQIYYVPRVGTKLGESAVYYVVIVQFVCIFCADIFLSLWLF